MTDPVSLDAVRHVAGLARIAVTDEQARELARDLSDILAHMDILSRVDTAGVKEYAASDFGMPLRADHGPAVPLDARPESFAPEVRDGFFVVPRLATHEDPER